MCGLTELAELKERESLTFLEMFKIFLNYEIKLNFFSTMFVFFYRRPYSKIYVLNMPVFSWQLTVF